MAARRIVWLFVLVPALPAAPLRGAEPDLDVAAAERLVRDAGGVVDGPGLVAFLKGRTPTPDDQRRLDRAVRRLGDDDFAVREAASRELTDAGRNAIPFLRPVLDDPDLEVSRRARDCLAAIQARPETEQVLAAVALLRQRRPDGAAEALLGYLPFAADDDIESAVFAALRQVGLNDGHPSAAVTAAVRDPRPLRRAAAAFVLGWAAAPDRRALAALLQVEAPRVRYEAGVALLRGGDADGLSALVALLADAPPPLAWQAEEVLQTVAADKGPPVSLGAAGPEERKRCRDAWEAWRKDAAVRPDLTRLRDFEEERGLTLVCEYDGPEDGGRVAEYGRDGKLRWHIGGLEGVNDVQRLPGGRLLIAERNGGRVTERNHKGEVLWEARAASPIACQRLPGGNTLITTFGEILEVAPDGKVLRRHTHPSGFRCARRLTDGHILYVSSAGEVVELDAEWKQVRSVKPPQYAGGAGYWATVERLPSGRYLVAYGGSERVVELDAGGAVVWEVSQPHCTSATRLRNGNTLISNFEERTLVEVDRAGKQVDKRTLHGRPFTALRY